ncbi:phosphate ABC transporter substrate-binding protein [Myxococcota bacterium]|nr:phosphate ABC transporter substrate-binding protein [Myxococcota bacterium]
MSAGFRFVAVAVAGLFSLGLPACSRKPKAGLTVAGSTSVQPFAEKWAEEYAVTDPKLEIHVQGGGSTAGVQATISGAANIGMCSRELKAEEKAQLTPIVVARDGLAIIVHPSNHLGDIDLETVRKIFTREISNWSELGGPDRKITVVTRENGSGARGAFEELVMKKKRIAAAALVQDSQGAVRQMVSSDPAGIGYVSHGVADASVKSLKVHGIEANEATVASGEYPLVRPFLFLVQGEPTGPAKAFIDWVLGPRGQEIAKKEGLFPVR